MPDKPIRIMHIMPQIVLAGAELQLYSLIAHSETSVVEHCILYYENSDENGVKLFRDAGIRLSRIYRNKKRPIKFLRAIMAEIYKWEPDIVHCWLFSGNVWGRWGAIFAGARHIIVTYRSCGLSRVRELRFLEMVSPPKVKYLTNSKAVAKYTSLTLNVPISEFEVIYNGVDTDRFDISVQKEVFKETLEIPLDNKIVTMAGRLVEGKNYPMLLKIARKCKQEALPVHFVIAGHGKKEKELRDLSSRLQINDIVHFLGVRSDMPEILKASDIFCFTSLSEGFPNVLMEAMAAGLPVVCTDFDGVDELVDNEVNCKIVGINDVEGAYRAVKSYLDKPESTKSYGVNARQKIINTFSNERMVNEMLDFYKRILEQ